VRAVRSPWLAMALVSLAACTGAPAAPEASEPPETRCAEVMSQRRLRRLSDVELAHVVQDVAGGAMPRSSIWAADPRVDGFDGNADGLIVHGPKLEGYIDTTDAIAANVARASGCTSGVDCALGFAKTFARRAYGRPLNDDELARLRDVYATGVSTEGHDAGLRMIAQAILLSPYFLYRTELGPDGVPPEADVTLTSYEVASQLSFAITGSRPDDALLLAAERGDLVSAANVRAEAQRLLDTPGAHDQVRRFFASWLDLARWPTIKKNAGLFPQFTAEVGAAMFAQAEQTIDDTVWRGSGTLAELLGTTTAFVPPALVPMYGDEALESPAPGVRAKLDPRRRKGILTLPALLAAHSPPDTTSPVERGLFVRVRLLCQEIGAPPLVANAIPADALPPDATTRQRLEAHAKNAACSGCHDLIDPPGFAFESFDAIGFHRDTEHDKPIDASGDLAGADVRGHFHDASELVDLLLQSDAVRACFVRQVFRFAEGRREQSDCETSALHAHAKTSGHRVQDILVDYAARPAFSVRRGAR
jgi:Protein of unknown function (DUF1592)/Protein of unknown function (DUF1588)/Protein of unknown function (DUF1595)/Protein of unknown function (DUF1585)/Protein of unknown function (DUF1587)